MTNTKMLRDKIKDSGLQLRKICVLLGITYATLRSKINNDGEFTASEIQVLSNLLGLTKDETWQIFLTKNVSETNAGD